MSRPFYSDAKTAKNVSYFFFFLVTLFISTRFLRNYWRYRHNLRESTLLRVQIPAKRNSRSPASVILCWVSWVENVLLIYYASSDFLFVYIGKNPRFKAFLDSNLHTRLAIVTENEPGLAFPPRNLPRKFRPDPSTFYLVIVVTNRQTDRQTYAGDSIIPRESFRGVN